MAGRFALNRLTHPRDDKCGLESFYAQSVGPGNYMTTNLVPKASGVNPVSVTQLNIYPREGFGYNNAFIDADSALRNQPVFNSHKCNIRPQARPYNTIPFMGNGRGNPDVESRLLHSEQVRLGKECGTVTEQFFELFDVDLVTVPADAPAWWISPALRAARALPSPPASS